MYEDFLQFVEKPARYIDNEVNVVKKDLSKVRTKVCLFFPDTYEVGMSHLGLRILYHILNSREDIACERVFSPWTDYEKQLTARAGTLRSLESNTPLSDFDIIGITLQYELSYTNALAGLLLSAIPLYSEERTDRHPVVIAGGPCAVNPEPLSDFIDAFFIGEAEEAVHEIVELRQQHKDRRSYLEALSQKQGFYVPLFGKKAVKRRFLRDLDAAPFPDRPLLPLFKPIHDRVNVEIARGCIRGCRFCQAGIIYRPYRERSPEAVEALIAESLLCTGYEEASLSSLSSGDYSHIQELVIGLMNRYRDSRVSISLPSLRIGTLTPEMISAISSSRKTGFTLAPEAGTERLRKVINKPVSEQDLLDAAETIFKSGWSVLKLYFMIGLPTETQEDLDGIARLAKEIFALGRKTARRHVQLNISISTFVPKPHTPFQWLGQPPLEVIKEKQAYLSAVLRHRGINLKFHRAEMSLLEAAFARGDNTLCRVLELAVAHGCRFDGWIETFDFSRWEAAFADIGASAYSYAGRGYALGDPLPWDHVETGVRKQFLIQEYNKAMAGELTENCRVACEGCGIGCRGAGTPELGRPATGGAGQASAPHRESTRSPRVKGDLFARTRLKYSKKGRIRFLSHLDTITLFQRAVIRAGVPVAFSQGFNPHPKISFGPALSVGMESEAEYLDMETDPFMDLAEAVKNLNRALPEGVKIIEARMVSGKLPSLTSSIERFAYRVGLPGGYTEGLAERIETFLSREAVLIEKEGKKKNIRPAIESITLYAGRGSYGIEIILREKGDVRARVQDVIEQMFGPSSEETAFFRITRTAQFISLNRRWVDPMEQTV